MTCVRIGPKTAHLTPGVVDATAVDMFTRGGCWYLAWVLHQLSGLDIVTLGGYHDGDDEYDWVHVGVVTPERDQFLDVTGLQDLNDAMEYWLEAADFDEDGAWPVDPDEFATQVTWDPATVDETSHQVTRTIAVTLLERHGVPILVAA